MRVAVACLRFSFVILFLSSAHQTFGSESMSENFEHLMEPEPPAFDYFRSEKLYGEQGSRRDERAELRALKCSVRNKNKNWPFGRHELHILLGM